MASITPVGVMKLQSYTFLAYGTAFVFAPDLMLSLYFNDKVKKERITKLAIITCGISYISSCLIFLKTVDKIEPSIQKYILGINGAVNVGLMLVALSFKDLYKSSSYKQVFLMQGTFLALNINAYRKLS